MPLDNLVFSIMDGLFPVLFRLYQRYSSFNLSHILSYTGEVSVQSAMYCDVFVTKHGVWIDSWIY
jgi:hypothetical protein